MTDPGFTEAQFTDRIVDTAHLYGWRAAHFRPAQTKHGWRTAVQYDGKGWPDLFLVHPATGDVLAAEVKLWRNRKVTAEQASWLGWLTVCRVETFVWTEREWDAILHRLANHPVKHSLYTGGNVV